MALVTIQDIKKYRDWLIKQPSVKGGTLSAKHINQQMIFVHKLFDIAISKGFRKDNPCSSIRRLPDKHKEMSYYTPEQFKEFDTYNLIPILKKMSTLSNCFTVLLCILEFAWVRLLH